MDDTRTPTFRAEAHDGALTDLGCPECPGVLTVLPAGSKGYLGFRCRIGHVYSPQSLVEAKEGALEETLWSAVVRLEELLSLYLELSSRAAGMGRPAEAAAYRGRIAHGSDLLARLRGIAQENRPAPEPEAP